MLRAIRIKASQQMPNYRKPASFLIKETFPLPPYSSIIGMVHSLCGWKEYHPMRISVQGKYASTVSDYATNYVFGITYDPTRHQKRVHIEGGKDDGINVGPKSYELLTDVELILHIVPDDDFLIETIFKALKNPPVYPSLGRHEDLIQIDELDIVDLNISPESKLTANDIYIPLNSLGENAENVEGTIYRLNKVFEIRKSGRKDIRVWKETVLAQHVCKGKQISSRSMYIDSLKEDIVFLA